MRPPKKTKNWLSRLLLVAGEILLVLFLVIVFVLWPVIIWDSVFGELSKVAEALMALAIQFLTFWLFIPFTG